MIHYYIAQENQWNLLELMMKDWLYSNLNNTQHIFQELNCKTDYMDTSNHWLDNRHIDCRQLQRLVIAFEGNFMTSYIRNNCFR